MLQKHGRRRKDLLQGNRKHFDFSTTRLPASISVTTPREFELESCLFEKHFTTSSCTKELNLQGGRRKDVASAYSTMFLNHLRRRYGTDGLVTRTSVPSTLEDQCNILIDV
ncbi:hypothetical protein V6N13_092532 [Hibiscus sabdariffa]|uniref:Uncharacterized protein n=2 Tax=Hibiscus sabdariffa TaxID=183260 RepID=A0ABR2CCL1_9ROSI